MFLRLVCSNIIGWLEMCRHICKIVVCVTLVCYTLIDLLEMCRHMCEIGML